jgi:hypothetical protein
MAALPRRMRLRGRLWTSGQAQSTEVHYAGRLDLSSERLLEFADEGLGECFGTARRRCETRAEERRARRNRVSGLIAALRLGAIISEDNSC